VTNWRGRRELRRIDRQASRNLRVQGRDHHAPVSTARTQLDFIDQD
jgi:hypothetical protein